MVNEQPNAGNGPSMKVELSGESDEVLGMLEDAETGRRELEPFFERVGAVIDYIDEEDGATRGQVFKNVLSDRDDADNLGSLLAHLAGNDYLELTGNTWRLGPRFEG